MYSPANRVFLSQNAAEVVPSWSCAHNVQFNTFYIKYYNNYMIEENDNYKVMFYFLSPNVLLLFVFKIASWNVLFFLRNSVLCIWLSSEVIKH